MNFRAEDDQSIHASISFDHSIRYGRRPIPLPKVTALAKAGDRCDAVATGEEEYGVKEGSRKDPVTEYRRGRISGSRQHFRAISLEKLLARWPQIELQAPSGSILFD